MSYLANSAKYGINSNLVKRERWQRYVKYAAKGPVSDKP